MSKRFSWVAEHNTSSSSIVRFRDDLCRASYIVQAKSIDPRMVLHRYVSQIWNWAKMMLYDQKTQKPSTNKISSWSRQNYKQLKRTKYLKIAEWNFKDAATTLRKRNSGCRVFRKCVEPYKQRMTPFILSNYRDKQRKLASCRGDSQYIYVVWRTWELWEGMQEAKEDTWSQTGK